MDSFGLCYSYAIGAWNLFALEWANFRAHRAAGAPWLVMQHRMLGPPTLRVFGFQLKDMRRAGRYTTAAAGAAVVVDKR